jgi:hypothetical protein
MYQNGIKLKVRCYCMAKTQIFMVKVEKKDLKKSKLTLIMGRREGMMYKHCEAILVNIRPTTLDI